MTKNEIIASPCIRNCCLNEEDVCLGCFRHIDEILAWGKATNEKKIAVLALTKQREISYRKNSRGFLPKRNKPR
jgi:predicted Fe-S protein YdhL (DUF1289 family)